MIAVFKRTSKKKWYLLITLSLLTCFVSLSFGVVNFHRHQVVFYPSFTSKTAGSTPVYEGEFSAISYNVAGLPELISSAETPRSESIAAIGRKLNAYAVAHVQEDFNYNDELYNSGNNHPYRTSAKGMIPYSDGLNTLSRFPITEFRRIPWTDCTDADCFTLKGFSYSRIEITAGTSIDFYNIHANAANHPEAAAARRKNMLQFSDYVKTHSAGRAVIIMGDLNAHYSYTYDNVDHLLKDNGLLDAWILLYRNGKFPKPEIRLPNDAILKLTDTCESIDKVLFRSSSEIELLPKDFKIEKSLFTDVHGKPLSDHCPVSLSFAWRIQPNYIAKKN
ncbi:endonuclease/exonuclease/phosphatase family protein [Pedobacter metabolipauper]|uniref:Endonuclease/exonuclease/phosphatase family protein n=1 Tax=Pedobacter metabolipauper TaxID=425513 RepID=A0A4R6SZN6_9SPHI|nr:endonuclease/exonuclease/phosphatase family protein [Pedobacter metabolipauper]TDQ10015.1 endonuclease/exonuclease/phosphatase family protein [Pedobacter metabolipauper]